MFTFVYLLYIPSLYSQLRNTDMPEENKSTIQQLKLMMKKNT